MAFMLKFSCFINNWNETSKTKKQMITCNKKNIENNYVVK